LDGGEVGRRCEEEEDNQDLEKELDEGFKKEIAYLSSPSVFLKGT